jgi:hypothetical protein
MDGGLLVRLILVVTVSALILWWLWDDTNSDNDNGDW